MLQAPWPAVPATLVDLIDLSLQGKQAHWAMTGSPFKPLHDRLAAVDDDARSWYDDVAERMAAVGVVPDGRSATIVASTTLAPCRPAGRQTATWSCASWTG